jgi:hypothetical protein
MMPPYIPLSSLPNQAQAFARQCPNEKLAMTMQYLAVGSMILLGVGAAAHMARDIFRDRHHEHGR